MNRNNGTNRIPWYCCPDHHRTAPMFKCWNEAFQIVGFLVCSPNVNYSWLGNGMKDDSSDHIRHAFPVIWCPGCTLMTPAFTHLSVTFTNQRIINCSPTMDVGFVKLTLHSFCVYRVFRMNIQFCCHLCCSSSVNFWFLSTVPLHWWCLPMICACRYNLRNWSSRYT
jgi:hypothetical protein